MTVNRGLWVPINTGDIGTTEVEARLAYAGLFETNNGVDPRTGLLRPATANVVTGTSATSPMSYNIADVDVVVNRTVNEGVYAFNTTGTTNVTTTAAPGTNSRIDVIWVKQNDQSKGDANNLAVAGVTQGTVAASPVAPAIPAGAVALAHATITSTTTNTAAASIVQVWRHTALRGAPIPVRNATEQAEITTPTTEQRVLRLDLGRVLRWTGTRWGFEGGAVLGKTDSGQGGTLAATPSWADLLIVTATSQGGEVAVDFDLILANVNSGDHRTAAVRVTCDGTEIWGVAYFAQYIAGANAPTFPSRQVFHTPAAGAHTWKVQGNANVAGAIRIETGSMVVTERP